MVTATAACAENVRTISRSASLTGTSLSRSTTTTPSGSTPGDQRRCKRGGVHAIQPGNRLAQHLLVSAQVGRTRSVQCLDQPAALVQLDGARVCEVDAPSPHRLE